MAVVSEIKRENKKIKSAQLDRITDIDGKKFAEKVASTKVCKGGVNEPLASAVIYGNSKKLSRYQRDRYIVQKIPNSCINITVTTSATTSANTIGDYKCVLEPFVNHKVFARVVTSDKRVGVCWWKGYEGNYDTAYEFITGNVINGTSSAPTSLEGIYTITQGMVWTDNHHQLYTYKYAGLPAGTYNITVQLFDLTAMYGEGKEPTSIDALKLEYPEVEQENEAGGKVIVAKLPLDYTEVEYLQSTGTQWIDTNFIPTRNTEIEYKFNAQEYLYMFGCGRNVNSSGNAYYGSYINQPSLYIDFEYKQLSYRSSNNTVVLNKDYVYKVIKTDVGFKINLNNEEVLNISNNDSLPTNDYKLKLFGTGNPDNIAFLSKYKMYYFKIWDNNLLVRKFIPCIRNSDNKAGMFDLVSQTFFTNQGTGEFLTGANVSTIFNVDTLTKSGKNLLEESTVLTRTGAIGAVQIGNPIEVLTSGYSSTICKVKIKKNKFYVLQRENEDSSSFKLIFTDVNGIIKKIVNALTTTLKYFSGSATEDGFAYIQFRDNVINPMLFEGNYETIYEDAQTPQVIEGLDLASAGSARDAIYVNCKDNDIDLGKVWKKTVVNRTDYSVLTTPQYEDITSTELGQALLNLSTYKDKTTVIEVDNDGNIDFEYWKQIDVVPSAYTRVRAIKSDGNQKITVQGIDADSMQYNSLTTSTPTNVLFQGDKERVYTIDGLSYKYNQFVPNGGFEYKGSWNEYLSNYTVENNVATIISSSLDGNIYVDVNVINSHKYLVSAEIKSNGVNSVGIKIQRAYSGQETTKSSNFVKLSKFFTADTSNDSKVRLQAYSPSASITFYAKNYIFIDLTDMFGSGNEPTTLEAFYNTPQGKLFQSGYVPYTTGAIHSVESVYTGETKVKDITLRSVGDVKDTWATDGSVTRRIGYVDLGSLDYTYVSSYQRFQASVPGKAMGWDNVLCSKYALPASKESVDMLNGMIKGFTSNADIVIKDSTYTNATTFKQAMNGVILYYEKSTPTTEQVEPVQLGSGLTFNDGTNALDSTMFYKSVTLWLAKYYKDGNATKNLIPVVRNSDLKAGLYDVLENEFLANEGTGDFTYECL